MTEIKREEFKKDPIYHRLYTELRKIHKVAEHTMKTLIEGRHIPDFCEEATHFVVMQGKPSIFLQYVVSTWLVGREFKVVIDSIGIYDDYLEYEKARLTGLHSADEADIPNQN